MSHHSWQSRESVGVQTDAVPTLVDEFVARAAACYAATASPVTVTEDVASSPAVTHAAPAPVIEYVAPATPETVNAYVAPAPVFEYIAPPPAVFYPSFYTNDAVTGLVNPQFSITAAEVSQVQAVAQEIPEASQVVGSFSLSEDFAAPVSNPVYQEQIIATAQPHAIVQEIPEVPVVEWIQE